MGTLRDLQFALQLKIEELRQRDALIDELELELDTKDELIRRLQEELDRYRTAGPSSCPTSGSEVCLDHVEKRQKSSRKTVISESFSFDPDPESHRIAHKNQESQRIIQAAFMKNDLLKNLEEEEMQAVISRMYPISIHQGCQVIQEGTSGAQAFVLEEGRMEVSRAGVKLLTIGPGDMLGEETLLYECSHSSTVSAQTECKLWVSDRHTFKRVLMGNGIRRVAQSLELLCSVPCLQSLPEEIIMNLAELMHETHYAEGDFIVRQGCSADNLYVISKGRVKVAEKCDGEEALSERHWFGEEALSRDEVYGATIQADSDVSCWLINRQTLKVITCECLVNSKQRMFPITESKVQCPSYLRSLQRSPSKETFLINKDSLSLSSLGDFHVICGLGVGQFGHVDLVQLKRPVKSLYAMRVLKKTLIGHGGQREQVLRERRILLEADCQFIVRFHKTFRDAECLYVLMEACLHGDLYILLRERGLFDERSSRFYAACVAEALTFLHDERVVHRDVKPENVLLDQHGFAKLSGSRCLKRIEVGKRTYSFCGTPGYTAPEITFGQGHSFAADFWSLGVLVFELLSGRLPFSGPDPIKTLSATFSSTDQIDFPKEISESASCLIKQLCRLNPAERLGGGRNWAKDIHRHTWFEGFNWDGLGARTLNPPAAPQVEHLLDSTRGQYMGDATEPDTTWDDF